MKKYLFLVFLFISFISKGQHKTVAVSKESKPFVLGVIEEIQSSQLAEKRILNIYLPEGYQQNDTITYPVLYLLDGSADEDFIHIAGLVQYFNFPWINTLPKTIVVGIANTNRKRDFTFKTSLESDKKIIPASGGSDKFIAFLEQELQPFIEKKYKTKPVKTIIGQSLGGLLAAEILLKKPSLFSTYIIISPSLWWDNGSLLALNSEILKPGYKKATSVYIGVGKEGETPGTGHRIMEADAEKFADKIKRIQCSDVKVFFDFLPNENHATVTHPAVFNAFRILNPAVKSVD